MKTLISTLLLFLSQSVIAGGVTACESVSSGDWSNPTTWTNCGGSYPQNGVMSALIKANHTVTLDLENLTVYGVDLELGAEILVPNMFPAVSITTSNGGFDSELGHIEVLSNAFTIDAQVFTVYLGTLDGATHLTINSTSNVFLFKNIGQNTAIQSLTTDAGGSLRTQGQTFYLNLNGSQDTVINDNYSVGPSSRAHWTQNGPGDIVFNGFVKQISGSPQQLTVNLDGGNDVHFNDEVRLGRLTTNGSGNTIINTASVITVDAGANDGDMIFNTPVLVATDVTFATENLTSDIFFNAGLDDDGNPVTFSFVTIDTPNNLTLNDVGQNNLLNGLDVVNANEVNLYGDITTTDVLSFNAPVLQHDDLSYTNPVVSASFLQGLDAQNNDAVFNFGVPLDLIPYSSNLSQINSLTLGPLGKTVLSGGTFSAANDLTVNNSTTPGFELLVSGASTLSVNTLSIVPNLELNSTLTIEVTGNSQITGIPLNGSTGSITKTGSGRLVLPAGSNWNFITSIAVDDGELHTNATHNHFMSVSQNGLLTGAGILQLNTLNMSDNAALSPGDGVADYQIFTVDGINMTANTELVIDISGSPALNSDSVATTGGLITLAGTLTLRGAESSKTGDTFTVINNNGPMAINGQFSGLPEGAEAGVGLTISYVGGDGNDVVLTATCDAQIVVNSGIDSGAGSLRQAITDVCDGGEVVIDSSSPDITLATPIAIDKTINLTGNFRTISGGSVSQVFNVASNGDLRLNDVRIVDANSGYGAIRNNGLLAVNQVYFANNESSGAGGLGGGAIVNYNIANINKSVFYQNNAFRGGALFNNGGATLTVNNSTFYQNGNLFSAEGGVIHNRGTTTMTHVTMADSGDGDVNFGNSVSMFGSGATMNLINTVIAGTAMQAECSINQDTTLTLTNTFIHDGSCGATLFGDAQLDSWQTVTPAGVINPILQHLPPLPGSPLVNAADNGGCISTDQLGRTRPQGVACDIGAIEIIDNNSPDVAQVGINDMPIESCGQAQHTTLNSIEISFDERVIGAESTANYSINLYDITGINVSYLPVSATSDGMSPPTVSLQFASLGLSDGILELGISGVEDEFGNVLNIETPLRFRIDQGNLLVNGHFDDCNGIDINNGWQFDSVTFGGPFTSNFRDYHDFEESGSVSVPSASIGTSYFMEQCVDLESTVLPLHLESQWYLVPDNNVTGGNPPPTVSVNSSCEQWDQAMCMGQSLGQTQFNTVISNTGYPFKPAAGDLGFPMTGAVSALCQLQFNLTEANGTGIVIDAIRLTQPDLIFADGFEPPFIPCKQTTDNNKGDCF